MTRAAFSSFPTHERSTLFKILYMPPRTLLGPEGPRPRHRRNRIAASIPRKGRSPDLHPRRRKLRRPTTLAVSTRRRRTIAVLISEPDGMRSARPTARYLGTPPQGQNHPPLRRSMHVAAFFPALLGSSKPPVVHLSSHHCSALRHCLQLTEVTSTRISLGKSSVTGTRECRNGKQLLPKKDSSAAEPEGP